MKSFFKQKFKKFFGNKYIQSILAWIVHSIIWFIYRTSRVTIKGNYKDILDYTANKKSIFLFTWHGKILLISIILNKLFEKEMKNGKKLSVLASGHRDGKIASAIATTFNFETIEGSTIDPKKGSRKNKKSISSIREIIKIVPQNRAFAFAADGPRGPAFKINTKITNIAQKIGIPIVCIVVTYKKKITLNTWDHFELPLPFGEIVVNYGKMYFLEKNEDIEKINSTLQTELDKLTER